MKTLAGAFQGKVPRNYFASLRMTDVARQAISKIVEIYYQVERVHILTSYHKRTPARSRFAV